jgi:hypothetical protein
MLHKDVCVAVDVVERHLNCVIGVWRKRGGESEGDSDVCGHCLVVWDRVEKVFGSWRTRTEEENGGALYMQGEIAAYLLVIHHAHTILE